MPTNYSEEQIATALELSIEKWKANTLVPHKSAAKIYSESCPLCDMFANNDGDAPEEEYCDGCPVKACTGYWGCQGTPWGKARDAYHDDFYSLQDFHTSAQAEVDFLESLRTPKP